MSPTPVPIETRSELIRQIVETELIPLLEHKGRDYSGPDSLSNFHDFGLLGIVVRIGDKYHRLKNIIKYNRVHVQDETIEDTLKDLANYALIALIYLRTQNE